jgi:signal transduction histidine kinase
VSATLIRDDSRAVSGFRGLARDVTSTILARKEKEKLQGQLNHAQRMEAVGTLAGGIAHDFNNLLMGIIGNTSLLKRQARRYRTVFRIPSFHRAMRGERRHPDPTVIRDMRAEGNIGSPPSI